MGDGGDLQSFLGLPVQALQLADGLGVGPHAHKMVHVMQVPVGECDHFFHDLRDIHIRLLKVLCVTG